MRSIIPGFCYELASHDGTNDQVIQMLSRHLVDGSLKTLKDGTTDSEVLAMLIDRANRTKEYWDTPEMQEYLFHLQSATQWLEKIRQAFSKLPVFLEEDE